MNEIDKIRAKKEFKKYRERKTELKKQKRTQTILNNQKLELLEAAKTDESIDITQLQPFDLSNHEAILLNSQKKAEMAVDSLQDKIRVIRNVEVASIKDEISNVKEQVDAALDALPEIIKEQAQTTAIEHVNSLSEKSVKKIVTAWALEIYNEAGSKAKMLEYLADEKNVFKFFKDILVPLAKAEADEVSNRPSTNVQINIYGLDDEPVKKPVQIEDAIEVEARVI